MNSEATGAEYFCIACHGSTKLKPKDAVRCSNCGKNILYKARDKHTPVQLDAR